MFSGELLQVCAQLLVRRHARDRPAFDQRRDVLPGATDEQRQPPACVNIGDDGLCLGQPFRHAQRLIWIDQIEQMMRHECTLLRGRFGAADVHGPAFRLLVLHVAVNGAGAGGFQVQKAAEYLVGFFAGDVHLGCLPEVVLDKIPDPALQVVIGYLSPAPLQQVDQVAGKYPAPVFFESRFILPGRSQLDMAAFWQ